MTLQEIYSLFAELVSIVLSISCSLYFDGNPFATTKFERIIKKLSVSVFGNIYLQRFADISSSTNLGKFHITWIIRMHPFVNLSPKLSFHPIYNP